MLISFHVASLSGRSSLMTECHGTAPSACTVLLIVSPQIKQCYALRISEGIYSRRMISEMQRSSYFAPRVVVAMENRISVRGGLP